jgi:pimeloyl-ACP methyl ester carboxylesterase
MYISELGAPNAEAVVFLHGTAVGGWMWQSYMSELYNYHCLLVDLPGHSKSNNIEWVSLADSAEQVVQIILERTSQQRAHLVGASLGGSVALQLLSMCPEVINHTLITGASILPMPGLRFFKIMLRLMAPMVKTDFFLRAALKALNFSGEDYEQFRQSLGSISSQTFVKAWSQSLDLRYSSELEKVKTPILLMAGEKESQFIHQSNSLLATRLLNAKARLAPKMGHGWLGESPTLFSRVLKSWLGDTELPSELLLVNKQDIIQ